MSVRLTGSPLWETKYTTEIHHGVCRGSNVLADRLHRTRTGTTRLFGCLLDRPKVLVLKAWVYYGQRHRTHRCTLKPQLAIALAIRKTVDCYQRNHEAKCTAYNKHTTCVYSSFFKPQSDMRPESKRKGQKWKQAQRAPASDLLQKTMTSPRALQRVVVEQTIVLIWFWQQKPPIKSALVRTSAQHLCIRRSLRHIVNCIGQLSMRSAVHHSYTWFFYPQPATIRFFCSVLHKKVYFITKKP